MTSGTCLANENAAAGFAREEENATFREHRGDFHSRLKAIEFRHTDVG